MLATCTDIMRVIADEDYQLKAAQQRCRMRAVRRRLAEGWYDREEILDNVLERILRDIALA